MERSYISCYLVLRDRPLRSGGDGKVDTPVPIPNTEVKHFSGDNSYACRSEDNTLPGQTHNRESFFIIRAISNTFVSIL